MEKPTQILIFICTLAFAFNSTAQELSAGSDIFLTVRGQCQESDAVKEQLKNIFAEPIESSEDELAVQKTLKSNVTADTLTQLQQVSRCIVTLSNPETIGPLPEPMFDEEMPLPEPKPVHPEFFENEKQSLFNDPLYRKQSFLKSIEADSAFRRLLHDSEFMKTPVRIGIIDEGPANPSHEDLAGQLLDGSTVANSSVKHGQYVLGIMAARAGNAEGIVGVAGINSQFMYRAMTYIKSGKVNSAHIANTVREFGRIGMDAVNLSIAIERDCTRRIEGIDSCHHPLVADPTIRRAIQETARTYGTVFVLSASNESQSVPRYVSPEEGILVVGSSNSSEKFASYSNFGPGVDIYVPDSGVYGLTKDGYSSALSGTSFAAPVVTAVAALTRHYFTSHGQSVSAGQIARHILRNSSVKSNLARNESSGLQLNFGKTVMSAQTLRVLRR